MAVQLDQWKTVFVGPKDTKVAVLKLELEDKFIEELWDAELNEYPKFMLYGKECRMRRKIGFFSNVSQGYKYTGQIAKAIPLTTTMERLIDTVNTLTGQDFNGLLFNLYVDGNDYIGAHRDDESNLTDAGVVALSLGSTRKFRIRDFQTKRILADLPTQDCELMWLLGDRFHKDLTHEIPIEKKVKTSRLSITFRKHLD